MFEFSFRSVGGTRVCRLMSASIDRTVTFSLFPSLSLPLSTTKRCTYLYLFVFIQFVRWFALFILFCSFSFHRSSDFYSRAASFSHFVCAIMLFKCSCLFCCFRCCCLLEFFSSHLSFRCARLQQQHHRRNRFFFNYFFSLSLDFSARCGGKAE